MRFTVAQYGISFRPIQLIKFDTERAGFTIQALATNAGLFYISKDPNPTQENAFAQLAPGEMMSGNYVGALYCMGDTLGDRIFAESFSKIVQESGHPAYQ